MDVFIAAGKIVGLGESPHGFHANREIDASNMIVCPGLVDLSARLREPGFEYKATLESEMAAAVAGGITSLAWGSRRRARHRRAMARATGSTPVPHHRTR